jgi:hypothetical protein
VLTYVSKISTEAIQAATATVVQATLAASVSSSVAASTAVAPTGLVQMITVSQVMSSKATLSTGFKPPMMSGMTTSVPWIQLQSKPPFQKKSPGRRLLEQTDTNPWEQCQRMLFWVSIVIVPLFLLHFVATKALQNTKHQDKLKGLMAFPALELIILNVLVNPFVKVAAALIREGTPGSVFAGIGIVCLHPGLFVLFAIWYIHHAIFKEKTVFFMYHPHEPSTWRRFTTNTHGVWYPEEEKQRMGALFDSVHPPAPHLGWRGVLRTYYVPWNIIKTALLTFLLTVFAYATPVGKFAQVLLIVLLQSTHVWLLFSTAPVHKIQAFIPDVFAEILDTSIYAISFVSLSTIQVYGRNISEKFLSTIDSILFALQSSILGVQIVFQVLGVAIIVAAIIRNKIIAHNNSKIVRRESFYND